MYGGARNILSGAGFVALSSFEQPDHSSALRDREWELRASVSKDTCRSSKTEQGVPKKPYGSYRQFRIEGEEWLAFADALVGIVGSRDGRNHALIERQRPETVGQSADGQISRYKP